MSAPATPALVIPQLTFVTVVPMQPPEGLFYSTRPEMASEADGTVHVIKGGSAEVVAAEVVGYSIARECAITVPNFGVGSHPFSRACVFASQLLHTAFRAVDPFLARADWAHLSRLFAVDVLLANTDRNIGNLIAVSDAGAPAIVAIDFEKSQCVRLTYPLTEIPSIEPANLRPTDALYDVARDRVSFGSEILGPIQKLGDSTIAHIVDAAYAAARITRDSSSCIESIRRRRDNLHGLVSEAWK